MSERDVKRWGITVGKYHPAYLTVVRAEQAFGCEKPVAEIRASIIIRGLVNAGVIAGGQFMSDAIDAPYMIPLDGSSG